MRLFFGAIILLIYLLNIYDILDITPKSQILDEAIDQTINNRARGVLCQVGKRGEVVITEENEVTPEELCVQSMWISLDGRTRTENSREDKSKKYML